MTEHHPLPKVWTCRWCGDPWPCRVRQNQLIVEHEGRRSEVGAYMAVVYPAMRRDLAHEDAGVIYKRLFSWIRPGLRTPG